jgi:adenosylcobinamide-GDP ribazoletransferase
MVAIRSLLWTISFLTIIPTGAGSYGPPPNMGWITFWFPWVGMAIGLLGGYAFFVSYYLIGDPIVAALLAVVVFTIITRAIHLDGLADTFDGFLGGATRDRRLEIMRDSRLGTFGVVALVLVLFVQIRLLSTVCTEEFLRSRPHLNLWATLMVTGPMVMVSRWAMVYGMAMGSYARQGQGTGKSFCDDTTPLHFLWASLFPIAILACFFGLAGIPIAVATILCASIMTAVSNWKIGGVTGDTIGATGEIMIVVFLLSFAVLQASFSQYLVNPFTPWLLRQ